jgi:hypothetical protein
MGATVSKMHGGMKADEVKGMEAHEVDGIEMSSMSTDPRKPQ